MWTGGLEWVRGSRGGRGRAKNKSQLEGGEGRDREGQSRDRVRVIVLRVTQCNGALSSCRPSDRSRDRGRPENGLKASLDETCAEETGLGQCCVASRLKVFFFKAILFLHLISLP